MDSNMNTHKGQEISLLDLIYAVVQNKNFVIRFTLLFALIAVIYSLVTPKLWISRTIIQPITENSNNLGLDTGLLDMLGGGGILPNGKEDQSAQFIIILQSRTFREDVARKFDLIKYFKITEPDSLVAMEIALKKLTAKMVFISLDPKNNTISISVETKDKKLSRDIAQYYVSSLDHYNKYNKLTKSRMKRQFLEQNVNEIKTRIDSLGVAVRDFQRKNHAIAPNEQMISLIGLYSEAVSKMMQIDLELELGKQTLNPNSPQILALHKQKELMSERVKDLENNNSLLSPKYLLEIDKIPDITLRYAQLTLNLEIQKKIFEYLYPQYEAAKIEELRDMPTMEVIDSANLAGLRSKPKRAMIVVLVTFAAFMLASVISIIQVYMSETQKSLFRRIMGELSFKSKV